MVLCLLAAASFAGEPADLPDSVRAPAEKLRDGILAGSRASDWVRQITDAAGPRMPGTPGDRAGVAAAVALLKAQGFAGVRAERVIVPAWARGVESGEVTAPSPHALALTALGGSVGTPPAGVEAEIVRVASLEELGARGEAVRGRIVFIDRPMSRTSDGSGYGDAAQVRSRGPSIAGRLGALGVLVRSVGTDDNRLPHTGAHAVREGRAADPGGRAVDPGRGAARAARAPRRTRARPIHARVPRNSGRGVGQRRRRDRRPRASRTRSSSSARTSTRGTSGDGRARRRRRMRHRHRGRETDRGAAPNARGARSASSSSPTRRTGCAGGKAYAEAHAAELAHHVAAIESDSARARRSGSRGTRAGREGAHSRRSPRSSRRSAPTALGVRRRRRRPVYLPPVGHPEPRHLAGRDRYFDYHHTANDKFDKVDKEGSTAWSRRSRPSPLRGLRAGGLRASPAREADPPRRPGTARPTPTVKPQ